MDGGALWATVHRVANGWARQSDFTFTFHFHALEKAMATHSSVLAWRIPGTGEPGGLPSMGLHRVGHDWSDLAAAAAAEMQDPGEGKGNPLQYSSLENPKDRSPVVTVHGVAKSQTWLRTSTHTHTHTHTHIHGCRGGQEQGSGLCFMYIQFGMWSSKAF